MSNKDDLDGLFINHATMLNNCFLEIRQNGAIKENVFQSVVDSFNKLQKKYKEASDLKYDLSEKITIAEYLGSYEGWQLKSFENKEDVVDFLLNQSSFSKKRIFREIEVKLEG